MHKRQLTPNSHCDAWTDKERGTFSCWLVFHYKLWLLVLCLCIPGQHISQVVTRETKTMEKTYAIQWDRSQGKQWVSFTWLLEQLTIISSRLENTFLFCLVCLYLFIRAHLLSQSPDCNYNFALKKKKREKKGKSKEKKGGADLGFVHEGVCRCIQMHAHGLADTCTHFS